MEQKEGYGQIIFLNGTSSSGKTSIAKALEAILSGFQTVALDHTADYADYLPKGRPITLDEYASGFHRYVRELASTGKNLIVDHALQEPQWAQECAQLFADYEVLLVGVRCPLYILKQREQKRPERQDHARYQFYRVHRNKRYDIEVDTSRQSPEEIALRIQNYLRFNYRKKESIHTSSKFFSESAK